MKIFHCDHCRHLLFFENTVCVGCQHLLAYLPDIGLVASLDRADDDTWVSPLPAAAGKRYRLCENYGTHQVCNWAVDVDENSALCLSCRLTRVIPNLAPSEHRELWYKLEAAKRRLVFTLLGLRLPLLNKEDDPGCGLAFEFKADVTPGAPRVLTGHAGGVITINLAEADDVERERRRKSVHEPYRTLLGHMRHEIGHYYWDRLVAGGPELDGFRALFGDERLNYGEALEAHYAHGAPANWQATHVSAYATAHPWEDWAETWAHYLHMVDALETASACGVSLQPRRRDEPSLPKVPASVGTVTFAFDDLLDAWFPLTYVLNNLNRGLGLPDAYPFILSTPAIEKLRHAHDVIARVKRSD